MNGAWRGRCSSGQYDAVAATIRSALRPIAQRVFGLPWRRRLPARCPFRPRPSGLWLKELGLSVPWGQYGFLLEAYDLASRARSLLDARFDLLDGLVRVEFGGISLGMSSAEELFILDEIFVKTCYGWRPSRPTLVVDVGANVGMSCLYFAGIEEVRKVVGFEPFPRTLREAERNLGLNPRLSRKIQLHPFGLGPRDERIAAEYSFTHKGRVSPVGGLERVKVPVLDRVVVDIEIRDAASVVRELLAVAEGLELALKLDCEGSEYGIASRLAEGRLLEAFRTVFIEWHGRGPEPLLRTLTEAGFTVFSQQGLEEVGFIRAAR